MTAQPEYRKDAAALVRALSNNDTQGATALLRSLDRNELEQATLYLAGDVTELVVAAHVEELDLVLNVLNGVADLDSHPGSPGAERRAEALSLTKRLIGHAVGAISARRDQLAGNHGGQTNA